MLMMSMDCDVAERTENEGHLEMKDGQRRVDSCLRMEWWKVGSSIFYFFLRKLSGRWNMRGF